MAEMKKIDSEALDKVGGGTAAFESLKEEVNTMIPLEVQGKLKAAKGGIEVHRILTENGVDVERIEKKITASGFDPIPLNKIPDEALDKIAGGSAQASPTLVCRCGASGDELTMKVLETFWSCQKEDPCSVYQCEKCGTYIHYYMDRIVYEDRE